MIETAALSLATFFATIGPLDVAAIFAALTANSTRQHRRSMAVRGTLIATLILVLFALVGEAVLGSLGISLAALRTAGGILLLLIAIEMVFARTTGGTSTTDEEEREAMSKQDISVFPIATPLIAGPGAMGAAILLMADAEQTSIHALQPVFSFRLCAHSFCLYAKNLGFSNSPTKARSWSNLPLSWPSH